MTKVALINHGCSKNLVDSELMLGMLAEEGAYLIDSAAHFITAAGGQASRRVYPDERGGYCYNGRGYGVFSI